MGDPPTHLGSRLTAEEKKLLRQVGTALHSLLQGTLVPVPESDRRDELGILCALANRIGAEIIEARQRDAAQQKELKLKLQELAAAYAQQEQLLETIRALSSPVLHLDDGVLLLPIIGHLTEERSQQVLHTLLEAVVAHKARFVILDVTSAQTDDARTAVMISRAATSIRLLGAELLLSGVSADFAKIAVSKNLTYESIRSFPDLSRALGRLRKPVSFRR